MFSGNRYFRVSKFIDSLITIILNQGGFQLLDLIIRELKIQGLSLVEILFVKKDC